MSREIVANVLGPEMTREVWTGNYEKALPVSVQDFDLSAVLPAVFYMFRYGQRRGKGRFLDTFAAKAETKRERRQSATIERIAERLGQVPALEGFSGEAERAILGDLLLCFCLENVKHSLGRTEQVQRVAPAHYMAAWVDLPESVGHLRYVPEMVLAMLADQGGEFVQQNPEGERKWFAVGREFETNVLLKAFHAGVHIRGELASRTSDRFDEATPVGVDQLLMIRLAQQLGEAPDKIRGGEGGDRISNQRPIAERAARNFSDDIRRFVRSYAGGIPRQTFVHMLESCMAVGLTTILTSVIEILLGWAETGIVSNKGDQRPAPLFVDASNGTNRGLRALAEHCFDDFTRRIERFPVVLMAARLLDWSARYNRRIRRLETPTRPYATEWLNLLGNVLHNRHEESPHILYELEQKATILAEKLREEVPDIASLLEDARGHLDPVWRLAEALTLLQGRGNTQSNLLMCMDSCLLLNRPNGLAAKRRIRNTDPTASRKTREIRSPIFTDHVLDYLVHLHLLPSGKRDGTRPLAFRDFLALVRNRYGFCVDEPPPGMAISNDLLQANRAILERRLRDLGLLTGVNDAETMKRLSARFTPRKEEANAAR